MLARIFFCGVIGLEGVVIEVEVDTSNRQPKVLIVGLPDAAVQECRERVQLPLKTVVSISPEKGSLSILHLPKYAKKVPLTTFR